MVGIFVDKCQWIILLLIFLHCTYLNPFFIYCNIHHLFCLSSGIWMYRSSSIVVTSFNLALGEGLRRFNFLLVETDLVVVLENLGVQFSDPTEGKKIWNAGSQTPNVMPVSIHCCLMCAHLLQWSLTVPSLIRNSLVSCWSQLQRMQSMKQQQWAHSRQSTYLLS